MLLKRGIMPVAIYHRNLQPICREDKYRSGCLSIYGQFCLKTNELTEMLIHIGKTSDDQLLRVDLKDLPHLFLSYGEETQLYPFYKKLVAGFTAADPGHRLRFSCALTAETYAGIAGSLPPESIRHLYITNDPGQGDTGTKYLFLQALMRENKKRQKQRAGGKPAAGFTPLVVILDNVLDMVITRRKYTGLYFLQLLMEGPETGIHFIATSSRAYRNIMGQLLNSNPVISASLGKQMPGRDISLNFPLGAELVITTDELYFFKRRLEGDFCRYFPESVGGL